MMLFGKALNQFSEKVHIFGVNINGGNGETFQEGETFFEDVYAKESRKYPENASAVCLKCVKCLISTKVNWRKLCKVSE